MSFKGPRPVANVSDIMVMLSTPSVASFFRASLMSVSRSLLKHIVLIFDVFSFLVWRMGVVHGFAGLHEMISALFI